MHPKGVVIRDGEDPYFVVAADKGTATFSDVANGLAMERDFWLGDAFASGGSKGYDHKAMGITAKGAWVSVQRHFAEMGIDVQTDTIRVVGCGDMSGDLFGIGMLLSKAIKLCAAFDHRHIFLDPDPDPAKSWKERDRMFKLPRSSWDDYDKALISKGGGVFARSQKSIPLTPEVQALLGLSVAEIDPAGLISAILRAPADLLWFGGIGTYVKAAGQNNAEVGDPANDALRVDAEDLRVRAVGEGANLGVTQAARIAFAAKGGRINTDFIDNSAGVDCSDNEVNIKIALNREMAEGRLSQDDRDALLVRMTDDVAALVLEDNRLQALALSIAEKGGAAAVPSLVRIMETFEASGRLDRKVEGLAANDELLRRSAEGSGLTRPELAVLLSTAKLALQDAIEASALPDDPALASDLAAAFPAEMQRDFAGAIADHQLRREIIATKLANRIVNRMGIVHPLELVEEEGCSLGEVAAAFVAVERLLDMKGLWASLDSAGINESIRLSLFSQAASAMASQMADLLRVSPGLAQPGALVARLEPGVDRLTATVDTLLSASVRRQWDALTQQLLDAGAPEALTAAVVRLFIHPSGRRARARLGADAGGAHEPRRSMGTPARQQPGARFPADAAELPRGVAQGRSRCRGQQMAGSERTARRAIPHDGRPRAHHPQSQWRDAVAHCGAGARAARPVTGLTLPFGGGLQEALCRSNRASRSSSRHPIMRKIGGPPSRARRRRWRRPGLRSSSASGPPPAI